jgi:3-isopropylmalate/(R)-2-methylmalate dehydratase small subunit
VDLPTVAGGRGPRFLRHTGTAAVLELTHEEGATRVFPPSALELPPDASLLLTMGDFDPGIAPDAAAASLVSRGIRAVIAPGFEKGFYERSFGCGLLPAIAAAASIEALARHLARRPDTPVTVDLEKQVIECGGAKSIAFEVDPRGRNKLLLGLSDFDEMVRYSAKTAELRAADRSRRPWLYDAE